jgi:hypothetical protein
MARQSRATPGKWHNASSRTYGQNIDVEICSGAVCQDILTFSVRVVGVEVATLPDLILNQDS